MIEVKIIDNKSDWNELLQKTINVTIFASWEWGEVKSSAYRVDRLAFYKKNKLIGLSQIFIKKVGPILMGWGSSGINVTDYKHLKDISNSLGNFYDLKKTVIRFNFLDAATGEISFAFDEINEFRKVPISINSGYTIRYTGSEIPTDPKEYDSNARYYLKKAISNELKFEIVDFDLTRFLLIHNEMAQIKGKTELGQSEKELSEIAKIFGKNLRMCIVSRREKDLCVALILKFNSFYYYFLAGANTKGRELFSSFYMVDSLLKYLKAGEIQEFDFGGITPFLSSAKGVNRFKFGFGGQTIKYIGERNITHSTILNCLFNLYVYLKVKDRS